MADYVQKINGNYLAASHVVPGSPLATAISAIGAFEVVPLTTGANPVPNVNTPSTKIIYLTKDSSSSVKDPYTEWIYVENPEEGQAHWQIIGETSIDLTNYVDTLSSTGSGNFVTNVTKSGKTITVTKGNLPTATDSTAGIVKLGSATAATATAETVSTAANRTYAVQANSNGQLVVNVPWTDAGTALTFEDGHAYNPSTNPAATVESITSRIDAMDATVGSTGGTNVSATITEANGVITGFTFNTDNTENKNNKVSSWQTTPDNTHYPTEKLVKDALDGKATSAQGAKADTAVQSVTINGGSNLKSGTGVNLPLATTSTDGVMSSADKTKLEGIATGAEVNQNAFSNIKVGSTTIEADTKTDTLTLSAGNYITLTPDATNDKITIASNLTSKAAASGGTDVSLVTTDEKYVWNSKQDALDTQTAYTSKGTATKVPQITTNTYGQVTGITEVEITGVTPAAHSHGNITNTGTITATSASIGIAAGDALLFTDSNNGNLIVKSSATFDGSTTTKALTQKGTFETFYQKPSSGIGTSDLAAGVTASLGLADSSVQSVKVYNSNTELNNGGNVVIPSATSGTPGTSGTPAGTAGAYGVVNLELITL